MSDTTLLEQQALDTLKGVGPKMSTRLQRLGLHSLADVLLHLPLRYQDRTRVMPISSLQPGLDAVVEGEVQGTEVTGRRRAMLLCRLHDGSGTLTLRFF
ncbi:MAG: ATP-dependent DNA helicase RecG, partial [Candidatus Competibacteraceae bacterium]|nr:ATP-dependent DNA helicase RecG [Candidatus Competibacteraceae bacterium]